MTRSLRAWRIERGFSQRRLAELAGADLSTIWAIESGRRTQPHPETRKKIADALGVQPSDVTEFMDGGAVSEP